MRANRMMMAARRGCLLGGLLACTALGSAFAADAPGIYPVKGLAIAPKYSWTGFYFGVNAGGAWGSSDLSYDNQFFGFGTPAMSSSPQGWFGGLQTGYNWQFANNLVLGFEADVDFADINGTVTDLLAPANTISVKTDFFGTARLRLGYAVDRFLPYVTVGPAWASSSIQRSASIVEDNGYSLGWAGGAGFEYAFAKMWTVRAEYLYVDLGDQSYFDNEAAQLSVKPTASLARIGVNLKY